MVHYNPKSWFSLIFHAYSRGVMRTLTPALIFMTIFAAGLCYLLLDVLRFHESDFHTTISMHSLLGIVLGLFLVFRTNSSYDRWWEGRKLWGSLVNNTRNLALKLNAILPESDLDNRKWFSAMIPNFVFATKEHLRAGTKLAELAVVSPDFLENLKSVNHIPNRLSSMMYSRINTLYKNGELTGDQLFLVDKELKEFTDIMGACERIRNTPIPYNYSMYIKQFIFIYLITLPFAFVTTSGYITIPIVTLVTFVLLSVELIAEEIEDPFGLDINDLPTDELAVKIDDNVREILLPPQSAKTE
ncbi:MAG TPA: bestrophin family protein [Cyclobacteriaceae bacterium]|jgi:putative membrane protein|nr:bestrophin family protein [Cytophagales bacterium]HRE66264.1 bestrophin family protein [Cyclobacteriaceae bacterium]HRF34009.1 bestrophin family protein [Cyclobacteriaceae bacterium]